MDEKIFSCSRDKFSVITTFLAGALGISMFLLAGTELLHFADTKFPAGIFMGTFLTVLLAVCYGFSPRAYTVNERHIIINRLFGNKNIPAEEIKTVRLPAEKELNWPIRKLGNGGLFGYTGLYYTKHIGNMQWYCSRRNNYVIIERKNGKALVISPDQPAGFLLACKGFSFTGQ